MVIIICYEPNFHMVLSNAYQHQNMHNAEFGIYTCVVGMNFFHEVGYLTVVRKVIRIFWHSIQQGKKEGPKNDALFNTFS